MNLDLSKMCDKCFKSLSLEEQWFGFNVTDIHETVRLFKGHEVCIREMSALMVEIYGVGEEAIDEEVVGEENGE